MKKITLSIFKLVLIFAFIGLMPKSGNATHLMGSDFTYKCEGNGKFRLILKIYRDCRGVPLGGSSSVRIEAPGCGTQTVSAPNTEINDVTPKCVTATGPCSPQNQRASKGIEEHVYEVVVDFTQAPYKNWAANGCCKVYFSWQSCCRNGAITTGVSGGFYSYAMLDICNMKASKDTLCNNSPDLTNPPVAFACCNQPFTYNNGASDNKDFDSLSYQMVGALGNSRTNVLTPSSPLTVKSPMTVYCGFGQTPPCTPIPQANPPIGFFLDSTTGDIIFTPSDPTCEEVGVIAIQVNEWRKDTNGVYKLIGITRRDIQVWVERCDKNNPPKLLGPYAYSVCEGDKLCFDVRSKDDPVIVPPPGISQVPDTTYLSWNKGIPGATFDPAKDPSVRERIGEFCWEPQIGQASSLPYTFTVTAKDQACPRPAVTIRGYAVTVKKRAIGERVYDTFPCGKLVFECNPEPDFQGVPRYLWTLKNLASTQIYYVSGKKKDSFRFRKGGTYISELVLNNSAGCPTVYLDTIQIPKFIEVELAVGDTFVCENDSMHLIPRIGYASLPITYDWTYATTGQQISTASSISVLPTRDTSIAIFVTDNDKCTNTDTVFIHWQELSRPWLGQDERICTYDTHQIVVPYDSTLVYRWNDGSQGDDTTLTVNVAGKYWLHTIDSLGCFGRDTFELFVNDTVVAYAGPDDTICAQQTYELNGMHEQDPSKTHLWSWYNLTTGFSVSNMQNVEVTPLDSTKYRLHLQITEGTQTCEDDDTMHLKVNQLPDLTSVRRPKDKCLDEGQFDLGAANPIGAGFNWSEKANSDVWYTMKDSRRDTMVRKGTATPNWYYTQRFFDLDKNQNFIPTQNAATKKYTDDVLIHVKHNITGCEDSMDFTVSIAKNPDVVLSNLTRCQDAGSFSMISPLILKAPQNPNAGIYTWEIDSAPTGLAQFELDQILEDRNNDPFFVDYWFNPMNTALAVDDPVNVKRLGTYKLKFSYKDGLTQCSTIDSVYITVEKLPEIAFTPFDRFCYSDDTINLNNYVNLPQGRWELINFNNQTSGTAYNYALGRMLDSTRINVIDTALDAATGPGQGGSYYWRYVNVTTGCPVRDSVVMDVNPEPRIDLMQLDTVCLDAGAIDLLAQMTTPSTSDFNNGGPLTGWSGPGVTGSSFDPSAVVTPNPTDAFYGPFSQTLVMQNPNTLCIGRDSINVVIQAPPTVTITPITPACEGETFTITAIAERATSGTTWTTTGDGAFNDITSLTPVYTPGTLDNTNYGTTLTLTSNQPSNLSHCPAATATANVEIHAYPVFQFGDLDSGCTPVVADFKVDPLTRPTNHPVTYLWDFGNGQTSTDSAPQGIVFTNEGPYNVKVTVTNTAGSCATTLEDTLIRVFPIPVASFTSNPDFYTTVALPKFQFTNTSTISNGYIDSFNWDFDNQNARYTAPDDISNLENPEFVYADDTMEYEIRYIVTSDKGCSDTTSKLVKIGPDITVFIPTAFSPDGAGPNINNRLFVSAQGYIGYNMKIFNRWGEKLFESNHPVDEQWDGTYNGEACQQDVYMYIAKVIAFDGKEYEYSGTVTLIR